MEDIDVDIEGDFNPGLCELEDDRDGIETVLIHPWSLQQEWLGGHCSDEESQQTIQRMIQEENYYIHGKGPKLSPVKTSGSRKLKLDSPASKLRRVWSEEERQILLGAMEIYGNKWSKIAGLLPGRSVQQVANFGHKHLKKKINSPVSDFSVMVEAIDPLLLTATATPVASQITVQSSPSKQKNKNTSMDKTVINCQEISAKALVGDSEVIRIEKLNETDSDIDIENDHLFIGCNTNHEPNSFSGTEQDTTTIHSSDMRNQEINGTVDIPVETNSECDGITFVKQHTLIGTTIDAIGVESESKSHEVSTESADSGETDDGIDHIYECQMNKGPTSEKVQDRNSVDEEEQKMNSDYFGDKSNRRNSERYLEIRNTIIDLWNQKKPAYLSKTSIRTKLKGDVNSLGQIHAYLEQIGAINFGCINVRHMKENRRKCQRKSTFGAGLNRQQFMDLRKRYSQTSKWLLGNEKAVEGKTFDHTINSVSQITKTKRPKQASFNTTKYDPFKLISCKQFDDRHPAGISVQACRGAVSVMDAHSHLCMAEVIGLLGGRYCDETHRLYIERAEPCQSISTGVQCEMDPVSQTEASERLSGDGMSIVGWYHSHPTFAPNPSVRDLETQRKFQDWFARDSVPFVGIIVNPYAFQTNSRITCLTVDMSGETEMPYEYIYSYSQFNMSYWDVVKTDRVNLSTFHNTGQGRITCRDKIIQSVISHFEDTSMKEQISVELRVIFESNQT